MTRKSKNYLGIMVSSTFTDLEEHRREVITAINGLNFMPVVMEHSGATPADLITQSLNMVADCAAYVLLISHKYGQTPKDKSNPESLSITELEFNEAVKLACPRLLFVMSDDHPITKAQIETDPTKQAKLEAFKLRAKLANPNDPDSDLACIYEEFSSPADLAKKVALAIARLTRQLPQHPLPSTISDPAHVDPDLPPVPRPSPPTLRALPSYGVWQRFVGRRAELETLDDWSSPNDPHPILLFEAIGGAGKSMLTWHWLNSPDHAAVGDWAGRFWYSFYEQGATLAEFCWEALNYFTGFPVEAFRKMRGPELAERLLAELNARRWLLVLDGIERILVGYQRLDAPQLRDEDIETVADPIANRDPCLCIRPEDDDLLRRLAQISGSKLLVSSRLTPVVYINRGGGAISGVRRELLKGLRPADALALFRAFGVEGPDSAIQNFLHAHCDGHPLTVGALAGLVNAYPPDHGNFVKWRDDPRHGGALNLADCDLVQKRNHILDAAIAALAPKTHELLQGLALLRGGADYDLLLAINPFLPPRPEEIEEPEHPEETWAWSLYQANATWRQERLDAYHSACQAHRAYLAKQAAWQADPAVKSAPRRLDRALGDLERRGLLQFDKLTRRYDLHPVVRGVASGRMRVEEVEASGTRLVDYCQAKSPEHWDDARTLADVEFGLQTVYALLRMGRFEQAFDVYGGSLSDALFFNLEATDQILALLRGFFPDGWDQAPALPQPYQESYVITVAGLVLPSTETDRKRNMHLRALRLDLPEGHTDAVAADIYNFSGSSPLPVRHRLSELNLALAHASRTDDTIFRRLLDAAWIAITIGDQPRADDLLANLTQRNPPPNSRHFAGEFEQVTIYNAYYSDILTETVLTAGEDRARVGKARSIERNLATLRGRWLLDQGHSHAAIAPLQTAIAMARDVGREDLIAEAALALARLRSGETDLQPDPTRWDTFGGDAALYIARFWQHRGEQDRALAAAMHAFRDAHEPGEPYVWRWLADNARALLAELGELPPDIPPYDPAADASYPWEDEVRALIDKLEARNAASDAKKAAKANERPRRASKSKARRRKPPE